MKTRKLFLVLLLVLVVSLCGTVFAYMYQRTRQENYQFRPATVTCSVQETIEDGSKTSIEIRNDGSIDAYLRLRLVSYWVNSSGEIIAKTAALPTFSLNTDDWIAGANDTYYYKSPVSSDSPNNLTSNLLSEPVSEGIPLAVDDEGNKQVIEVFAEAIQSEPQTAVTSSWGVNVDSATGNLSIPTVGP